MELEVRAALVEPLPALNGGALLAMALVLGGEYSFEAMYWLHRSEPAVLEVEERLCRMFGAVDSSGLPDEIRAAFLSEIQAALPTPEEIFAQYGI